MLFWKFLNDPKEYFGNRNVHRWENTHEINYPNKAYYFTGFTLFTIMFTIFHGVYYTTRVLEDLPTDYGCVKSQKREGNKDSQ